MSQLLFGLFLLVFSGSWLAWMVENQRTPSRGLWKPSYERKVRPGAYWQQVGIASFFGLLAVGLVAQSTFKMWDSNA